MDISANSTLNIAKVCLGFATNDVQLTDIYLTNFYVTFKIYHIIACIKLIRPLYKEDASSPQKYRK